MMQLQQKLFKPNTRARIILDTLGSTKWVTSQGAEAAVREVAAGPAASAALPSG